MILYLDASALVKRYVAEMGSEEVEQVIRASDVVGTGLISRAEVSAGLAKAARVGVLDNKEAAEAINAFRKDWADLVRVAISEAVVARADGLAWQYGLHGYDAVHLATALVWQEVMGETITLASYERQLWEAAQPAGLVPFPEDLDER
jgi:predicted nucleic acid-binding protein